MKKPPLLLCIETSSSCCSVALFSGDALVGHSDLLVDRAHARLLPGLVDQLLEALQVDRKRLSAVALSCGPGSYTGLRIGSSTAKGFCFGLDIPLVVVPTLEAMAWQLLPFADSFGTQTLFCPWLPCRAGEIYYALYTKNGAPVGKEGVFCAGAERPFADLKERICFVGGTPQPLHDVLGKKGAHVFCTDVYPTARTMGKLAYEAFRAHRFTALEDHESAYLRDFLVRSPKA